MKTFEPNKTITEMKEWDYVYVSDDSEEGAIEDKIKEILIRKCSNWYVCVASDWEKNYLDWKTFETNIWEYAVPALKTITLEVTEEQEREINNILNK